MGMGKKTRVLSTILTLIAMFVMLQGGTSAMANERPISIPSVNFVKAPVLEYEAGDVVNFDLHSPSYGGRVEYRVVLWDDSKKEARDLWTSGDRYYTKWTPYGNNIFNLHWRIDEPGSYRITVYVKRAGLPNAMTKLKGYNCDSYMESKVFVVKAKLSSFNQDGQVYGAKDKNKPENFSRDVNLTGQNTTFSNAIVEGNLNITGNNAKIENVQVKGKIIIDPGKDGNCTLNNVISKNVEILSGGKNSIHIVGCKIDDVNINSESPIRVEVDGDTEIIDTTANGYTIFDRKSGTFGVITITKDEKGEAVVEFRGNIVDKVIVETSATIKTDNTSSIAKLFVNTENSTDIVKLEGSYGHVEMNNATKLEVKGKTNIGNLTANQATNIYLYGGATISKLEGNEKNISIIKEAENNTKVIKDSESGTPSQPIIVNPKPPEILPIVNSVEISPKSVDLLRGGKKYIVGTVNTTGGAAKTLKWTSSDTTGKVTVDEAGYVRVSEDADFKQYTITATSTIDSKKSATAVISVVPGIANISGEKRCGSIVNWTMDFHTASCNKVSVKWYRSNELSSNSEVPFFDLIPIVNGSGYELKEEDIGKVIKIVVSLEWKTASGTLMTSTFSAETSKILKKRPPAPPPKPSYATITDTYIIINGLYLYEYSIDNGLSWQSSLTFNALKPNTSYSIIQRVKETTTQECSIPSPPLIVSTWDIVTATASDIVAFPGISTISLSKDIVDLSALNVKVYKNNVLLDNNGSCTINKTGNRKFSIAFTTSANIDSTSVIKVQITWNGNYVNGTNLINIKTNIPIMVSSITIKTPNDVNEVCLGTPLQMAADIQPEAATDKTIGWSVEPISGNAIIGENGLLSGTAAGDVRVVATNLSSGIASSRIIEVIDPVVALDNLVLGKGIQPNSTEVINISHNGATLYAYKVQKDAYNEEVNKYMALPGDFSTNIFASPITASAGQHIIIFALDSNARVIACTDKVLTDNEVRTEPIKIFMSDGNSKNILVHPIDLLPPNLPPTQLIPGVNAFEGLPPRAITVSGGKVYWFDENMKWVKCADMDGTNVRNVVSILSSNITALAVDESSGRIYWADFQNANIYNSNLDGTDKKIIICPPLDFSPEKWSRPTAMVISGQRIYWAESTEATICIKEISNGNFKYFQTNAGPEGITSIAVDEVNGKIYWSEKNTNIIKVKELSSIMPGTIFKNDIGSTPPGEIISIVVKDRKVYWLLASSGIVKMCNIDGSNEKIVFQPATPLQTIGGMAIE